MNCCNFGDGGKSPSWLGVGTGVKSEMALGTWILDQTYGFLDRGEREILAVDTEGILNREFWRCVEGMEEERTMRKIRGKL